MDQNIAFRDRALRLIEKNFGKYAAELYSDHYAEKERTEIIASVKELLEEAVGPVNAEKQLRSLFDY